MPPLALSVALDLDVPLGQVVERARTAESLGFSVVYVPDHSRVWRNDPGPEDVWFDGWTALAAVAAATSTVRIGTLVSNPVLRPPDLLARQALAVDHLSDGRLELGVGTGIAGFDHEATGSDYWPLPERLARYREYVQVLDGALRAPGGRFEHAGTFYRSKLAGQPRPVQQPRPPITAAGASKTVRAVAVERGEGWNTHGAFGVPADELPAHLASLNKDVTARCEAAGRDPGSLRRSVLAFGPLDPWVAPGRLVPLAEQLAAAGFDEAVVFWPWDGERLAVFERDVEDALR